MYHDNGVKVTWKRLNTEMSQKNGLIKLMSAADRMAIRGSSAETRTG